MSRSVTSDSLNRRISNILKAEWKASPARRVGEISFDRLPAVEISRVGEALRLSENPLSVALQQAMGFEFDPRAGSMWSAVGRLLLKELILRASNASGAVIAPVALAREPAW